MCLSDLCCWRRLRDISPDSVRVVERHPRQRPSTRPQQRQPLPLNFSQDTVHVRDTHAHSTRRRRSSRRRQRNGQRRRREESWRERDPQSDSDAYQTSLSTYNPDRGQPSILTPADNERERDAQEVNSDVYQTNLYINNPTRGHLASSEPADNEREISDAHQSGLSVSNQQASSEHTDNERGNGSQLHSAGFQDNLSLSHLGSSQQVPSDLSQMSPMTLSAFPVPEADEEVTINIADIPIPIPPPSEFISHLHQHSENSTFDLMQQYLSYEESLRKAFANPPTDGTKIDDFANLISIYDDPRIHSITTDRDDDARNSRYIMKLTPDAILKHGDLAISPTMEDYRQRFDAFTYGTLVGLAELDHVVVAGSAALLPLLPRRADIRKIKEAPTIEKPWEAYYRHVAKSSDIDLFLYGLDSEADAIKLIYEIERQVRERQGLGEGAGLTLRSENAITFIAPRWPYRHVQVILRLYESISEMLTGFDVDCACVAFDGRKVYSNPRGVSSIATRTNNIDLSRRSPSYEYRLWKYRQHNFDVFWKYLDRPRVDTDLLFTTQYVGDLRGLARLLWSEYNVKGQFTVYRIARHRYLRTLMRINDVNVNPSSPSAYAAYDVPYGERYDAEEIRKFIITSFPSAFFGTVREAIPLDEEGNEEDSRSGKVRFLVHNPGRQMIGSHNPIVTEDDWTEDAYI